MTSNQEQVEQPVATSEQPAPEASGLMVMHEELRQAYAEFQRDSLEQFRVKVRRARARQLRDLLSQPEAIDLTTFNREVWPRESRTQLAGEDFRLTRIFDEELSVEHLAELEDRLAAKDIEMQGNSMWGSGSKVFYPGLPDDVQRTELVRRALRALNDSTLGPIQKAREIKRIKGFGDNSASGLVMVFHPTEFAIYNSPSQAVLRKLGHDVRSLEAFEESALQIKDLLNVADFIEQDWFLFQVNRGKYLPSLAEFDEVGPSGCVWKIAPYDTCWNWDECVSEGVLALGWNGLGDLSGISQAEFEARRNDLLQQHSTWKSGFDAVWKLRDLEEGDRLIAIQRDPRRVLGVGTVTGKYFYDPDAPFKHCWPVEWNDTNPQELKEQGPIRILAQAGEAEIETYTGDGSGKLDVPEANTWLDFIQLVLQEAGEPLHYKEITQRVLARGMQYSGQTPENTVNYRLTTNPELFERVQTGVYQLRKDTLPPHMDKSQSSPQVWLFQANADYYNLKAELAGIQVGDEDGWTVTRYKDEMQPGDTVLLWQAGEEVGVYAIGQIIGEPVYKKYGESPPAWIRRRDEEEAESWSVPFRYTQILPQPVLKAPYLTGHPVLKKLQVIRSPQGTNFRVTPEEWTALQELLAAKPEIYQMPSFAEIQEAVYKSGLRIDARMLRRYHLSLQTRGFVILAGISGTGKTWLTSVYANAVGAQYHLVPVAPNWTTNEDLLGYLNPITGHYHDTSFSAFLREAAAEYERAQAAGRVARPYHLVLDEMNLARVEYYFAKFLSAMEMRARGEIACIDLAPDHQTRLTPNVFFVGTVNMDETTHVFADKVYDRSQLVELQITREALSAHLEDKPYRDLLMQLWDAVHSVAPFGFRVLDEIQAYVAAAEEMGETWQTALDEQILQKVLPKLKGADHSVRLALEGVVPLMRDQFPLSHAKAERMLQGAQYGFASYF
jgi:hypothetical protein